MAKAVLCQICSLARNMGWAGENPAEAKVKRKIERPILLGVYITAVSDWPAHVPHIRRERVKSDLIEDKRIADAVMAISPDTWSAPIPLCPVHAAQQGAAPTVSAPEINLPTNIPVDLRKESQEHGHRRLHVLRKRNRIKDNHTPTDVWVSLAVSGQLAKHPEIARSYRPLENPYARKLARDVQKNRLRQTIAQTDTPVVRLPPGATVDARPDYRKAQRVQREIAMAVQDRAAIRQFSK